MPSACTRKKRTDETRKIRDNVLMQDAISVTSQLKALRQRAGLTVRATATSLDMPASSYAVYEDGKRYKKSVIPVPMARKLADIFEKHGVERRVVMRLAGFEADTELARTPESMAEELDAVLLPEVGIFYSMGGGSDIEDFPVIRHVPFSRCWLASLTKSAPDKLFVARGDGDSMMPAIQDQDIVIIDRGQKSIRSQDRVWAIIYGGLGMIKRLRVLPGGQLQISSDNPNVSPFEAADDEAFLVGRVIAVVRRL